MTVTPITTELPGELLRLWPAAAPLAMGTAAKDIPNMRYLAAQGPSVGAAVIVCPGGGYGYQADHEGTEYGRWLNQRGIHAFILKYRVGTDGYRHPAMLLDVARALRTVRANAAQWRINPAKIGVMGSSAGGHLAATLLTHFDAGVAASTDPIERVSSRPDVGILCYPVIDMGRYTHQGSRQNLLGDSPSADLVADLSCHLRVTAQTPPTFLWHTAEDGAVPAANSLLFAQALGAANVPYELHIYPTGRHGLGLAKTEAWPPLEVFLRGQGFCY